MTPPNDEHKDPDSGSAPPPEGVGEIKAVSISESLTIKQAGAPPRYEWSDSPEALEFWWGQLHYAFGFKDPREFPVLPGAVAFSDTDIRVLRQYLRVAQLVARSTVLNSDMSATISFSDEVEEVSTDFVPDDAEAGFLARFRLLYPNNAHGGFAAACGVLKKHLSPSPEHLAVLEEWESAAQELRQKSVERICLEAGIAAGHIPPMGDIGTYPDTQKPKDIIDEYFNGEYFHWQGLKAEAVDRRREDPVEDALEKLNLLKAVVGLAYVFIGFSEIVEKTLREGLENRN